MKQVVIAICFIVLFCGISSQASAIPTQYGDSGLFNEPSAETLNAGNICLGVWANHASLEDENATMATMAITLGLGSFLEMYGSYPNLLFNGDEDLSGRGFANLGAKIRFFGKRSSHFKMAIDGQAQRHVSDNQDIDELTDYLGRLVASLRFDRFAIHANGGYVSVDTSTNPSLEDQVTAGGGIELFPTSRLRLIAETSYRTEQITDGDAIAEATGGFQYFVSPHFTINLAMGYGLTDAAPDWRVLGGISACQGIGTYRKPVPTIVEPALPEIKKQQKPKKKIVKIKTLSPLVPIQKEQASKEQKTDDGQAKKGKPGVPISTLQPKKSPISRLTPRNPRTPPIGKLRSKGAPVSSLEVQVNEQDRRQVRLDPGQRLVIPNTEALQAVFPAPVAPPAVDTGKAANVENDGKDLQGMIYRRFALPEFSFEIDQATLSDKGKEALAEIAETLRNDKRWYLLRFDGHTDNVGSATYNEKLSRRRAATVASHFVSHSGFDPARIFIRGFGESRPIADNKTELGRQENRRVEILVMERQTSQ